MTLLNQLANDQFHVNEPSTPNGKTLADADLAADLAYRRDWNAAVQLVARCIELGCPIPTDLHGSRGTEAGFRHALGVVRTFSGLTELRRQFEWLHAEGEAA